MKYKRVLRLITKVLIPLLVALQVTQASPTKNGQSLVGKEGIIIDCRTEHDSYFPDPDDCRSFYHCSDWAGLEHKSCGTLFFHPQKRVCDWPYIVRRIRHDCPADGNLPPLNLEVVVTDLASLGASEEEGPATDPPFDDGSYVRFEPEPENKFRFPTTKPRPKSKLKNKKQKTVFEENVDSLKRASEIKIKRKKGSHASAPTTTTSTTASIKTSPNFLFKKRPTITTTTTSTTASNKPSKSFLPSVFKKRPTTTTTTTDREVPVRKRPTLANARRQPITRHQIERTPIVKSLPPRTVVKSLPDVTTRKVNSAFRSSVPNARQPFNPRADRERIPKTSPEFGEENKKSFRVCANGRCFDSRDSLTTSTQKAKVRNIILKSAIGKKDNLEQKKIKLLLEAAKVFPDEETGEESVTTTTAEAEIETTAMEDTTDPIITTEREESLDSKPSPIPFKKPGERPEFLGIIKKKADKFKEKFQAKEIKEDEQVDPSQPESKYKFTISKLAISTSASVSTEKGSTTTASTSSAMTETEKNSTTVTTTITTESETTTIPMTETSTQAETTLPTTPKEEVDSAKTTIVSSTVSESAQASPVTITLKIEETTKMEKDTTSVEESEMAITEESNEDTTLAEDVMIVEPSDMEDVLSSDKEEGTKEVYVVDAIPLEPKAQPLVDTSEEDQGLSITIRTKVMSADDGIGDEGGEDNHEHNHEHMSSYDMVMSVMDHFNLNNLIKYISGKPMDPLIKPRKPKVIEKVPSTTEKNAETTTSAKTMETTLSVPSTTTTTTTIKPTSTTTSTSTTEELQITTEAETELEAETEAETETESPATALPEHVTSTNVQISESVHIVLPEGYSVTTKKPTKSPKYMTIVRSNPDLVRATVSASSSSSLYASRTPSTSAPTITTKATDQFIPSTTIKPSKIEQQAEDNEQDKEEEVTSHPFGASLDYIRQRLQLQKENKIKKKPSTLSVLQAINSKTLAEAELRRNPPKFVSEQKRNEKKIKNQSKETPKKIVVSNSNSRKVKEDVKNEEDEVSKSLLDEAKLAERRKALFSNRARKGGDLVNPQLKKPSVAFGQNKGIRFTSATSSSVLNPARNRDLFSSESRFHRPQIRRPKSPPPLNNENNNRKKNLQPDVKSISNSNRQKSIRCRLLRQAC